MPLAQVPVASSMILSVGYDPDENGGTLHVTFHNGRTYAYEGVPENEFSALVNSPSVGQYFNATIKGQYRER